MAEHQPGLKVGGLFSLRTDNVAEKIDVSGIFLTGAIKVDNELSYANVRYML